MSKTPNINNISADRLISMEMMMAYGTMLTWLFVALLLLLLCVAVLTVIAYEKGGGVWMLPYIVISGAVGGFVSSLSRLYEFDQLPLLLLNSNFKIIKNRYLAMYALTPPLVGLVGAVVIYLIFAGELLKSELIPIFDCSALQGACGQGVAGLLD